MAYIEENLYSNWYESIEEAKEKGIVDIHIKCGGMRWYEKNNLVIEHKLE